VHLRKEAGWRAEYLHELTIFPGGKYDDQVDSTAQLLDWLKGAGREPAASTSITRRSPRRRRPRAPSRYR
jgi:hypothetical protein